MRWRLGAWPAWGELLPELNTQEECTEGSASNYEPLSINMWRLWSIYVSDSSEYHKLPLQMETPCCWRAEDHWRTRVFWEKRDTKLQELLYSKIIRSKIDYTASVTLCYLAAFVCLFIHHLTGVWFAHALTWSLGAAAASLVCSGWPVAAGQASAALVLSNTVRTADEFGLWTKKTLNYVRSSGQGAESLLPSYRFPWARPHLHPPAIWQPFLAPDSERPAQINHHYTCLWKHWALVRWLGDAAFAKTFF